MARPDGPDALDPARTKRLSLRSPSFPQVARLSPAPQEHSKFRYDVVCIFAFLRSIKKSCSLERRWLPTLAGGAHHAVSPESNFKENGRTDEFPNLCIVDSDLSVHDPSSKAAQRNGASCDQTQSRGRVRCFVARVQSSPRPLSRLTPLSLANIIKSLRHGNLTASLSGTAWRRLVHCNECWLPRLYSGDSPRVDSGHRTI